MREEQQEGGNGYRFFRATMDAKTSRDLFLEAQMQQAIQKNQFELYFQPRVDLRTLKIVGAEALIRWHHPEAGSIPPSEFIPIAEKSGAIGAISQWVLRKACEQGVAWKSFLPQSFKLSVNVSAGQFSDNQFPAQVKTALEQARLSPQCLELEITESMVVRASARALAVLTALKEIGVTIAIDDFGLGYSSLSYLKQFPIDILKIDQTFVRDVNEPKTAEIVKAMIQMAHGMRLTVVSEGVETAEQLMFLRLNSCDEIQGYYFSRPVPAAELEEMIRSNKKLQLV